MSESNKKGAPRLGQLVRVFADNAYHGVGLVVENLAIPCEGSMVLLNGQPLMFWHFELEEVEGEI